MSILDLLAGHGGIQGHTGPGILGVQAPYQGAQQPPGMGQQNPNILRRIGTWARNNEDALARLSSFGANLAAAQGPSKYPMSTGVRLGNALLGHQDQLGQMQSMKQRQGLLDLQKKEMEQNILAQKAEQELAIRRAQATNKMAIDNAKFISQSIRSEESPGGPEITPAEALLEQRSVMLQQMAESGGSITPNDVNSLYDDARKVLGGVETEDLRGKYDPDQWTVPSFAKFLETGDHSVLEFKPAPKSRDVEFDEYMQNLRLTDPKAHAAGLLHRRTPINYNPEKPRVATVGTELLGGEPTNAVVQPSEPVTAPLPSTSPGTPTQIPERENVASTVGQATLTSPQEALSVQQQLTAKDRINKSFKASRENNRMRTTVAKAMSMVGPWTAGYGGLLASIPASDARALKNEITSVRAFSGFQQLQAMRDASPTGGALGQVSEIENILLQSVIQTLDQLEKPAELMSALQQIDYHLQQMDKVFELDRQIATNQLSREMAEQQVAPYLETLITTEVYADSVEQADRWEKRLPAGMVIVLPDGRRGVVEK